MVKTIGYIAKKNNLYLVAHRLSTIKNADKIFFVENGEVADTK